jgi:hypothetical protein
MYAMETLGGRYITIKAVGFKIERTCSVKTRVLRVAAKVRYMYV